MGEAARKRAVKSFGADLGTPKRKTSSSIRAGRKRVCVVVSTPLIVHFFLRQHLRNAAARFDTTLATGAPDEALLSEHGNAVRIVVVPMKRDIALFRDVMAIWGLARLFIRERFDLVHTITPKAGLLGMFAAWVARVPARLHTFQGEVWVTRRGVMRALLRKLDGLVAQLATHLLVVSPSEREFLVREGIVSRGKAEVLGNGSMTGVDLQRFKRDPIVRGELRAALNFPDDALVILFVGRLTRDKGVLDLIHAFKRQAENRDDTYLVFVGPDEERLEPMLCKALGAYQGRVRFVGYNSTPERFFAAADILSLPSYREGFGNVIIEAAGCGIPAVASRIYGITDALVDGVTGLLHAPGDVTELAACLERLAADSSLRARLGRQALERVEKNFSQERLCEALMNYYRVSLADDHE